MTFLPNINDTYIQTWQKFQKPYNTIDFIIKQLWKHLSSSFTIFNSLDIKTWRFNNIFLVNSTKDTEKSQRGFLFLAFANSSLISVYYVEASLRIVFSQRNYVSVILIIQYTLYLQCIVRGAKSTRGVKYIWLFFIENMTRIIMKTN